jgi:hypothetical protein
VHCQGFLQPLAPDTLVLRLKPHLTVHNFSNFSGGRVTPEETKAGEMEAAQVNVKAVMEEIRRRVEEKQRQNLYRDIPMNRPGVVRERGAADGDALSALRATAGLRIEGEPITSHRPLTGSMIKGFKKFMRFWVRRYTDALFLQQSYFNSEVVNSLEEMKQEVDALKAEVERLKQKP